MTHPTDKLIENLSVEDARIIVNGLMGVIAYWDAGLDIVDKTEEVLDGTHDHARSRIERAIEFYRECANASLKEYLEGN